VKRQALNNAVQYVANDTQTTHLGEAKTKILLFVRYSFEYLTHTLEYWSGRDGYVTWTSRGKVTWGLNAEALHADILSHVGARQLSMEPMLRTVHVH